MLTHSPELPIHQAWMEKVLFIAWEYAYAGYLYYGWVYAGMGGEWYIDPQYDEPNSLANTEQGLSPTIWHRSSHL